MVRDMSDSMDKMREDLIEGLRNEELNIYVSNMKKLRIFLNFRAYKIVTQATLNCIHQLGTLTSSIFEPPPPLPATGSGEENI